MAITARQLSQNHQRAFIELTDGENKLGVVTKDISHISDTVAVRAVFFNNLKYVIRPIQFSSMEDATRGVLLVRAFISALLVKSPKVLEALS